MLIGYVSNDDYVALADVLVEFVDDTGRSFEARSRASGSIHVDLPPGRYTATLCKDGYGAKRVALTQAPGGAPHQFRLLADKLIGYVWPKSVRAGERGEIWVHSVEPFHLELWRYGWKKELIRSLGWHDDHGWRAMMQLTPDGDYTQTGLRWRRLGDDLLEAPSLSGLYYLHASTRKGDCQTFPWVVAPARPQAKVAVLLSDLNWNAYNPFGGRSNYFNAEGLPPQPIVNARQELKRYTDPFHQSWRSESYPLITFDRPEPLNHIDPREQVTDPIESRTACHLAAAEWRLLGWLERENFSYDLYTESQLHHGVLDLTAYRVLILGPHPEYWTRRMYDSVKRWVFDQGGRLIYLGGNGLNCEVEFEGDAMRVHNGAIKSLWPDGIGAESRFARRHESEANLLGVVFDPAGIMTAAPYRVEDGSHWVFAGTELHTGDVFGKASQHRRCPGGASGHETDKRSASSPANTHLLAKGLNPNNGGAEMVIFDTPSGGAVFSAGSICYVSSLLVDEGVSRVTANVLRRFQE